MRVARDRGFLGPGPVDDHIRHARAMAGMIEGLSRTPGGVITGPDRLVDLGSGGGIPALVLLDAFPLAAGVLIEAQRKRAQFLREAVEALGWADRVSVREERAEESGRDEALRERMSLVTARSFGPPAVLAECAAPLLRLHGRLVVSEPPDSPPERWDPAGLAQLGLELDRIEAPDGAHFAVVTKKALVSAKFPRRPGIPAKRPIWQ